MGDLPSVWTSDLSVAEFAAVRSVGFEPVGQVLGTCVYLQTNPYSGFPSGIPPARLFQQVVDSVYVARQRAAERMRAECASRGADGVVGVDVTFAPIFEPNVPQPSRVVEFSLIGTAVRCLGNAHLARPFLSHVSGQDFAKLIRAGYVPADLVFGFAYEVWSRGFASADASSVFRSRNVEVPGYTELANRARAVARRRLRREVRDVGADGAVVSDMQLHMRADMNTARATILGTAIASFVASSPDTPRPVLRLQRQKGGRAVTDLRLPDKAMRRLADPHATRSRSFTSALTVNEFLLVKEAGFNPLGFVLGSSIYHIGLQATWASTRLRRWRVNQELTMLSQAVYHARELAMTRMQAEADLLGADDIVGVRLDVNVDSLRGHLAEFIAIGTAVKAEDGRNWQADGKPFTSGLSGQDFWTLVKAGYAPLGLVMGSCVYHIGRRAFRQVARTLTSNIELQPFTQALYDARELAMTRMQAEADRLRAEGVVGVQLRQHTHSWTRHTTEFFAIGTAVQPTRPDHVIPPPQLVFGLDQ